MISKQSIDQIFQTARIEEVIGDFTHLKKSGSNYKALSPFTNEKTPSFYVSPAKQIFKCFSSGKGGNVITFLKEHEQMSYPEALRYLADKYQILIEEDEPDPEYEEKRDKRESLYVVTKFAHDFFIDELHNSEEGKAVGLSYFKERNFTTDTIKKFGLGYAPGQNQLLQKAKEKGYKEEFLLETGLVKKNDRGPYDGFRNRVIFPIHDLSGRPVGFGARTLRTDLKKIPKYINSPESEIYLKNQLLYGIHHAKNSMVKNDMCYMVEGYTDVLSMHQAGIDNVVASSGTSLTEGQIKLIKRYTPNITMLYDGDPAGIKASFRGIDLILEQDMNVKLVLLPEEDDPDSFARKNSKTEVINFLTANSEDFLNFKTRVLLKNTQNDTAAKAEAVKDVIKSVAIIPDHVTRNLYIKESANKLGVEEKAVIAEVNKQRRQKYNEKRRDMLRRQDREDREATEGSQQFNSDLETLEKQDPKELNLSDFDYQEKDLLRILFKYSDKYIEIEIVLEDSEKTETVKMPVGEFLVSEMINDEVSFSNPVFKLMLEESIDCIKQTGLVDLHWFIHHENEKIRATTADLIADKYTLHNWDEKGITVNTEISKLEAAAKGALYAFKNKYIAKMIQENRELLKNAYEKEEDIVPFLKTQKKLDVIKRSFSVEQGITILR